MQDQGYFGSWINPSFTLHWSRLAFLGWNRAWRWVTIEIKWKIRLSKTFSAAFVVQRGFNFWVRRLVNSPSSMMRIIQINWLYQQFSHMLPLLLLLVLLVLLLLFGFNLFVSSLYSVKRNIGMLSKTREKVKIRTWFGISITVIISTGGGGEGTPGNSWWDCAARFSKSWPDFRPKNVIFRTCFQTWPLKFIPVFRPGALGRSYVIIT